MVGAGMPSMPVVNVNNFLNVKDSRWLQLEVCREFQRNKCTRPDTECKFAHPPPNVEVQNGRVTACYDSIKGRCNREKPPCKYFHPPQHLKDQLLVNGRNHLAMKNALMTQIQGLNQAPSVVPGTIPIPGWTRGRGGAEQLDGGEVASYYPHLKSQPMSYYTHNSAPYLTGIATMSNFNPYIASSPVMTMNMADGAVASHITGVVPQQVVPAQKVPRTDRLEVCREFQRGACKRSEQECRFAHPPDHVSTTDEGTVTVCMDAVKGRCSRDPCRYFHPPMHLQAQLRASQGRAAQQPVAFPGSVVPYKRPAGDKSGMPVYQPTNTAAYQQALMQQLGGQSFVPVSCEYGGGVALPGVGGQADTATTATAAAAAANNHHAAASPAQPPTTSTSPPTSTTTSTNSPPSSTKLPPPAIMANNSSSSSSSSTGGGEIVTPPAVPLGPQQPVNVFSYTGYSLSKGLRPPFKPPAPQAPTMMGHMPMPHMSTYPPPSMQAAHMPNFHYGMGGSVAGLGMSPYVTSSQQMMAPVMTNTLAGMLPAGLGGLTAGMGAPGVGSMAGLSGLSGSGMPVMSPQIMLPQTHMSSLYHPQYTALSSNTQYSLAHGGEQPSKRLKTS